MILPTKKQFCDIQYARRIKELGVKQDSLWWWHWHKEDKYWSKLDNRTKDTYEKEVQHCSAFTVAELIYMLTKLRKGDIIIPVEVGNVANFLAQEVINEKGKV